MKYFNLFCLFFLSCVLSAQTEKHIIQFTGVVMSSDSLEAIPFVNIYEQTSRRGTLSNYKGFFSIVAEAGDTINFSAIGLRKEQFIIPANLEDDKYSIIQLMSQDTIFLAETIIYPWPSEEDFREAFLAQDIPDDNYELARKNLENEMLKEMGEQIGFDANMNQDYYTKQLAQKIYYAGQIPSMRIFDVFAWKQFIEAWQRGDYKKKD